MSRTRTAQHGTRTMYVCHKCRCEACTEAQRRYQREYRSRMYAQGYVFHRGYLRRPAHERGQAA